MSWHIMAERVESRRYKRSIQVSYPISTSVILMALQGFASNLNWVPYTLGLDSWRISVINRSSRHIFFKVTHSATFSIVLYKILLNFFLVRRFVLIEMDFEFTSNNLQWIYHIHGFLDDFQLRGCLDSFQFRHLRVRLAFCRQTTSRWSMF